jgi:DNA-binding NtrC family response regulator
LCQQVILKHWYGFFDDIIMKAKKVLVIDDEVDFTTTLTSFFEKKNCQVKVAHTLKEGMVLMNEFNPDFVFLDNQLPDGVGWAETQYILQKYPMCQLILMSGNLAPKTSARNFRIMEKPLLLSELEALVLEKPLYLQNEQDKGYSK